MMMKLKIREKTVQYILNSNEKYCYKPEIQQIKNSYCNIKFYIFSNEFILDNIRRNFRIFGFQKQRIPMSFRNSR